MTRKDYEKVAEVFRNAKTFGSSDAGTLVYSQEIIQDFMAMFKLDNDRFSMPRFFAACRGEDSHDSAGRKVRYTNA